MKVPIPKNRMEINHFPKDLDLALVILFTLLCIPFVLISPLNDTFFYKKINPYRVFGVVGRSPTLC